MTYAESLQESTHFEKKSPYLYKKHSEIVYVRQKSLHN